MNERKRDDNTRAAVSVGQPPSGLTFRNSTRGDVVQPKESAGTCSSFEPARKSIPSKMLITPSSHRSNSHSPYATSQMRYHSSESLNGYHGTQSCRTLREYEPVEERVSRLEFRLCRTVRAGRWRYVNWPLLRHAWGQAVPPASKRRVA